MAKRWGGVIVVAGLLICACVKEPPAFLERKISRSGMIYQYQVYVPSVRSVTERIPVILVLHGTGGWGDDNRTQVGEGALTDLLKNSAGTFPAIVIFPQCARNTFWTDSTNEAMVFQVLFQALKEWNGDSTRIYLTGVSMGGYGAWSLAARHQNFFAAIMPICGGVRTPGHRVGVPSVHTEGDPYEYVATRVGKTPTWIFHGERDPVIPVRESRTMRDALVKQGGNVRYSEFAGEGHQIWDRVYGDARVIEWFFAQRRSDREIVVGGER